MKTMLSIAFLLALFTSVSRSEEVRKPSADSSASCQYDRAEMLAMDYVSFDQTPGHGWRALTEDGFKCLVEGAKLISDYRTANNLPHPMLFWHEGQLRAANGSVREAVALMEQARPLSASIPGWEELVDATIAFLHNDRTAFDKASIAIDAVPQARFAGAVRKLGRCFGMPYLKALVCEK